MATSAQHAALDKVFEEKEEEYHQHSLMKPRFEDFKLQFEGLHSQVADQIPLQTAQPEEAVEKKASKQESRVASRQDQDTMPQYLMTGSLPVQGPATHSYIPTQPMPAMSAPRFDITSPVTRAESESPLSLDVKS